MTRRGRFATVVLGACVGVPLFVGGPLVRRPGDRGRVNRHPRRGVGAVGRALTPRADRDVALPTDGRRRAQLQRHRTGRGTGRAHGARLAVRLPGPRRSGPSIPRHGISSPASYRPDPPCTLDYGIRLGAAGATAAAIGFALDLEHVGWACAAALLVMRPAAEMQRLRSVGRIVAVACGALAGIALVRVSPPAAVYSVAVIRDGRRRCGHAPESLGTRPRRSPRFSSSCFSSTPSPRVPHRALTNASWKHCSGSGLCTPTVWPCPRWCNDATAATDQRDRPPRWCTEAHAIASGRRAGCRCSRNAVSRGPPSALSGGHRSRASDPVRLPYGPVAGVTRRP